ncbi:hypothetical protein GCM10009682_59920 [Luedemannella flava]|uniref:DUF4129 domain-containing protein n=1 Tax=Luedemannella flava TaxID=349316 RepID=A0ABN2MP64_9ACTN
MGERLTPLFDRYDALIDQARRRLDETAGGPLKSWLRPILVALAVTIGLVLALRLILTALTAGGSAGRWAGAVLASVLALILLVVVIRNVVISLIEPDERRLLLLALLTSVAAVLIGVEAFATLTVALADQGGALWTVERFYLWHLVDSVPLLEIPQRLGWVEPAVLPGLPGRLLELGFTLLVIPPLVRVGVAAYGFVEGQAQQRRYTRAVAGKLRGTGSFTSDPDVPELLVVGAGAGAAWVAGSLYLDGTLRVWSLATVAVLVTVAALLVVAATAGIVVGELAEQAGLVTFGLAAALVWLDSPARDALLPAADTWGVWGRIWATLGVWVVVLLVVLVLAWATPEFTDAVIAAALVLGFLGADAPAATWLRAHLTWQPWGVPLSRVVVAACACFAVAYLLRTLWWAARRPPVLGHLDLHDTASGLRQDLRGYALVAVQIVVAAGAALTLLRAASVAGLDGPAGGSWTAASLGLHAAAWHVVDSLPGPDVAEILGWRLTADVTGPWAGLVLVVAVAAVVIFSGLPILRTIVLWARLTASRPRTGQALAAMPDEVVANLRAVVDFLAVEATGQPSRYVPPRRRAWPYRQDQAVVTSPSVEAERRLVDAELQRPRLLDLYGSPSQWYDLADAALRRTAEAYRSWVRVPRPFSFTSGVIMQRSVNSELGDKVAAAREAVDEFADAVARWHAAWRDSPGDEPRSG